MSNLDVRQLVSRLDHIESVALLSSARSTNDVARRVVAECAEGELPLPSAMIVALEQTEGKGRGQRTWHSPSGSGIWTTLLLERPVAAMSLLPLEAGILVADFLRDRFALEARIKWPNDVLVEGRKLAGILIEARTRNSTSLAMIGIGINVLPLGGDAPAGSASAAEMSGRSAVLAEEIEAFALRLDRELFDGEAAPSIIGRWRALCAHREGDLVSFHHGESVLRGSWRGIDEAGHARIEVDGAVRSFAAGEIA